MVVKDIDIEKELGSGWEKFFMILIFIVFIVVLFGVLFILFNVDICNNMFELVNKILVVKDWVFDLVLDLEKEKLDESEK